MSGRDAVRPPSSDFPAERNRRVARILLWIITGLAGATFLYGIRW